MVTHSLQNITFTVIGDESQTKEEIQKGVPQGSSVSPALFNVLMNSVVERIVDIESNDHGGGQLKLKMFDDDVMLMAKHTDGLQNLLNVASQWALEKGARNVLCLHWDGIQDASVYWREKKSWKQQPLNISELLPTTKE